MHKFHPEFGKYTLSLIILNVKKRLKVHLAPKFIARIGGKLLLLHPSILLDVEMQSGLDSPSLTNRASMIITRNHTTIRAKRDLTFVQRELFKMEVHQERRSPSSQRLPTMKLGSETGNHPLTPPQRASRRRNRRIRRIWPTSRSSQSPPCREAKKN
jgi:hypothetical protein